MDSHNAIEINDLIVGYKPTSQGCYSYKSISCYACRGELVAVVGRNGVGKSTLLRSIARLQDPLSGAIRINGCGIADYSREQLSKVVSYIPAEPIHSPNTTIRDFVSFARYPYHGWFNSLSASDWSKIDHAIDVVGLTHYSNRFVDLLSDGERQRAMIAFAIAQDASIVLMDEPTAFLDLPNKFEVVRLLKEQSLSDKTIILSTHDIPTAFSMVDTIWLMLPDGLKIGAPEDLIQSNTINELMFGSKVWFDSSSGQFVYRFALNKKAHIKASNEIVSMWTKHALERNGFSLVDIIEPDVVCIEAVVVNSQTCWMADWGGEKRNFTSIRDLCLFVKGL